MSAKKFMQSLDKPIYRELTKVAKTRGITLQELIRVELVPNFLYGPISLTQAQRDKLGNGRDSRHRTSK